MNPHRHELLLRWLIFLCISSLLLQIGEVPLNIRRKSCPSEASNAGALLEFATIASLNRFPTDSLRNNQVCHVAGYNFPEDGGGGLFQWLPASALKHDGGTVLAPTTGAGRWHRIYSGSIDVRWFGATGRENGDDAKAIQSAVDSAIVYGRSVYVPRARSSDGLFRINTTIEVPGRIEIHGDGLNISGLLARNCNAIRVAAGTRCVTIRDLALVRPNRDENTNFAIIFAGTREDRCDSNTIKNVFIDGFGHAVVAAWSSSNRLDNIHAVFVNHGIEFSGSSVNNIITGCNLSGSTRPGTVGLFVNGVRAAPEGFMISNCLVYGFAVALRAIDCANSTLRDCILDAVQETGISIENGSFNWVIAGNYIGSDSRNGSIGIHLFNNAENPQIKGNLIDGNQITANAGKKFAYGILINGTQEQKNRLSNNTCNADKYDCQIASGLSHVIIGNIWLNGKFNASPGLFPVYENNVGSMTSSPSTIRRTNGANHVYFGSGTPIAGWNYFIGDRLDYIVPLAGGYIGEVCIAAGNPGIWKRFGGVSN